MLLKQKNVQRNTDFTMLAYKFVYVFFSLECFYSMLLCFHRDPFYIYIQMLSDDL